MRVERKLAIMIIGMLFLIMFTVNANAITCLRSNPYSVYNVRTEASARKRIHKYIHNIQKNKTKSYKIKFVDSRKLTYNMLVNRKRDGVIYVETTIGYVVNNPHGVTRDGYYLSYSGVDKNLKKGSKIETYCVYSPYTIYEDDIIFRTDRVLNRKANKKALKKAIRIFERRFGEYWY